MDLIAELKEVQDKNESNPPIVKETEVKPVELAAKVDPVIPVLTPEQEIEKAATEKKAAQEAYDALEKKEAEEAESTFEIESVKKAKSNPHSKKIIELAEIGNEQAIVDYIKNTASVIDLDTTKLTKRNIFDLTIVGEKNTDGTPLSEDDKATRFEQFETLPQSHQETIINSKLTELENKKKDFVLPVNEEIAKAKEIVKKAETEIKTTTRELIGETLFGQKVTPELAKEWSKLANEYVSLPSIRNSANPSELALQNAAKNLLFPLAVAEQVKTEKSEFVKNMFKNVYSPSSTGAPVNVTPTIPVKSDAEKVNSFFETGLKLNDPLGQKNIKLN